MHCKLYFYLLHLLLFGVVPGLGSWGPMKRNLNATAFKDTLHNSQLTTLYKFVFVPFLFKQDRVRSSCSSIKKRFFPVWCGRSWLVFAQSSDLQLHPTESLQPRSNICWKAWNQKSESWYGSRLMPLVLDSDGSNIVFSRSLGVRLDTRSTRWKDPMQVIVYFEVEHWRWLSVIWLVFYLNRENKQIMWVTIIQTNLTDCT